MVGVASGTHGMRLHTSNETQHGGSGTTTYSLNTRAEAPAPGAGVRLNSCNKVNSKKQQKYNLQAKHMVRDASGRAGMRLHAIYNPKRRQQKHHLHPDMR